jgi:hypothetical protein
VPSPRLPPSQWRSARTTNAIERLHEEFKRRIKTQTVLPSADTAAMLFWALLASGQINMRKVDGCPSGIRHVDGAKLNQALVWNVRTCRSDAKGEVASGQNREDESTDAEHRLRHRCCSPPAISCLGAFRTPAAGAPGWSRHPGVRKPAQKATFLPFASPQD